MVTWDVTIGGTTITDIFEIEYDNGRSKKLGEASVICANNTNNRSVGSGDEVTIKKNGTVDYTGFVSGKPTAAGSKNVELEIECIDKRAELKYQQVNRVFYQKDTGEIIRKAVNEKLQPYATQNEKFGNFIHKGESTSNWSTDIPKFDIGNIANVSLEDIGSDFLFLGWPEGSGKDKDEYSLTYSSVPSDAIPGDGHVDTFYTRMLVNNAGEQFRVEVDLRDNYGNNYIWPLDLQGSRFAVHELKAEEAVTFADIGTKTTTDGTLEYRFKIDGSLPESRGAAVDFASSIPYATSSRSTKISPTAVEDTGHVITRRVDRSIFAMIKEFSTEDGYVSYVDDNDVLHYEQGAQQAANLNIDYNSTPVINAKFNRDYQQIINKVTVQGAGDIHVTLEDSASIDFYGISAREKPIVDKQIQTEQEAIRRGKGFLKSHAWDDSAFEFEIADSDFQSTRIGDEMQVTWPPENINGTFVVTQVESDYHGIVTLTFTSTSTV